MGEADIDIEQVLSLAPDVHVLVYQGPNDGAGGYDTYSSIITQDEAKVVSSSWGLCEPFTGSPTARAEGTLFEEAAAQGQSIVAASGDEGSADCLGDNYTSDEQAVDDPSSQPFVTGAGGTSWTALGTRPPSRRGTTDRPAAGEPAVAVCPGCGPCRIPGAQWGHRDHQCRLVAHGPVTPPPVHTAAKVPDVSACWPGRTPISTT